MRKSSLLAMAILLMGVVGTLSISGVHAAGFPVVDARASTNGTTDSANAVVTLAGSQNDGDTLIVLHRSADVTASHGYPANWNVLFNDASDASDDRISAAWCKVSGTNCSSGGTITITQTLSKFASIAFTISNAIDPTIRAPEFATLTTGSSTDPNPGSLSPTGGSKDYLWIWAGGWEGEQTSPPSGNPTNYANPTGADSGTNNPVATNTRVATAERSLTAASEDPGSWTISVSDDWTATVIVVHPIPSFPVVDARATTSGTSPTANAVVTLDGSQNDGDVLIVLHRSADGTASHGYPANWNVLFNDASDASDDRISAAWCKVSGTNCSSGGTITITQSSSKFASIAFTISNAADPTIRAPEFATLTTGSSATPDPGNLSPTGGSKDYLWIWAGGWEGEQTSPPSGNPTNYANATGADSGTTGSNAANTRVATAERTLTASSEDPGSWTISASDDLTATVIVVHATDFPVVDARATTSGS